MFSGSWYLQVTSLLHNTFCHPPSCSPRHHQHYPSPPPRLEGNLNMIYSSKLAVRGRRSSNIIASRWLSGSVHWCGCQAKPCEQLLRTLGRKLRFLCGEKIVQTAAKEKFFLLSLFIFLGQGWVVVGRCGEGEGGFEVFLPFCGLLVLR